MLHQKKDTNTYSFSKLFYISDNQHQSLPIFLKECREVWKKKKEKKQYNKKQANKNNQKK